MNENRKRDIFYGVVAVATLIVAMIGATLAYFSISGGSQEGAVNAVAATVSVDYQDGKQVSIQATELIPSTFEVVKESYETYVKSVNIDDVDQENLGNPVCIDDNNRQVCSTYRFSIENDTGKAIAATLNAEHNGFTTESLSFAVYDLKNNTWLDLETAAGGATSKFVTFTTACGSEDANMTDACFVETAGSKTYNDFAIKSIFGVTYDSSNVPTMTTKNARQQEYEIVLFVKETNSNQNVDQGKSFRGTIRVDLPDGDGQISGCIGSNCPYNS